MIEKKVFESLPGCFLIVDPMSDYRIVEATEAYLRVTGKDRGIIGKPIFNVFPDNPENNNGDGLRRLKASFRKVLDTCKPDVMNIQRYDIQSDDTSSFELRYWKPVNIPVLNNQQGIKYIIHCVEDVTRQTILLQRLKQREANTQQQIADAVSTTQELERMEIGRELHDNINQLLITTKLYLGRALSKTPVDMAMAEAAYGLIEKAIEEVKSISEALFTTTPQEEDLMMALEGLISQVMSSGSINVHKEIELPKEVLIESKVKVAIFRIVQEQLTNVLKHAEAKNLYINLNFVNNTLSLGIRDDGKGFQMLDKKQGLGFQNMKSRVAVMDGSLTINSSPGDGCTIQVNIPISI